MGSSEKDIEKIVEDKVEKRVQEELERRETRTQDSKEPKDNKNSLSRRDFLKKLGAGAIGLGALSLAPAASKVTISDTGITKEGNQFWHQGNLTQDSYYNPDGNDTFILEKRTSDPSSATAGRMWYRTDQD